MHKLIDFVCDELDEIEEKAGKGEMSISDVQYADTLAHLKKNLLKSEEMMEEFDDGYSSEMRPVSMRGTSYRYDRSYARGRKRDSMGRYSSRGYSRADDMVDRLRKLMEEAPDDRTRQKIQSLVSEMEMM